MSGRGAGGGAGAGTVGTTGPVQATGGGGAGGTSVGTADRGWRRHRGRGAGVALVVIGVVNLGTSVTKQIPGPVGTTATQLLQIVGNSLEADQDVALAHGRPVTSAVGKLASATPPPVKGVAVRAAALACVLAIAACGAHAGERRRRRRRRPPRHQARLRSRVVPMATGPSSTTTRSAPASARRTPGSTPRNLGRLQRRLVAARRDRRLLGDRICTRVTGPGPASATC